MTIKTEFDWTEEAIHELRHLRRQGVSGTGIAKMLEKKFGYPFTRNMIICKLHRLDELRKQPSKPRLPRGCVYEVQTIDNHPLQLIKNITRQPEQRV